MRAPSLFKPKCAVCDEPASKSDAIFLDKRSVAHGSCLVEKFPEKANAELHMSNPNIGKQPITIEFLKKQLSVTDKKKALYLQIIYNTLERRFDTLTPETKIHLLLEGAANLSENKYLKAGNRSLNKLGCLTLAIECALREKEESLSTVARRMMEDLPEDLTTFLIDGIDYSRGEIVDWSQGHNLPVPLLQNLVDAHTVEKKIQKSEYENVYDKDVLTYLAKQLNTMRERAPHQHDLNSVTQQVSDYLKSVNASADAHAGLKRVISRTDKPSDLDVTVAGSLCVAWSYILSTDNPGIKRQLLDQTVVKLEEISKEKPCGSGMISRLVDIPTAIDFTFDTHISPEQLQEEIGRLAAKIDRDFDSQYGEGAKEYATDETENIIYNLKRDILLSVATEKLIRQRGLNSEAILDAVDWAYPPLTAMQSPELPHPQTNTAIYDHILHGKYAPTPPIIATIDTPAKKTLNNRKHDTKENLINANRCNLSQIQQSTGSHGR